MRECFICQSNDLAKFLSLGHQPPSDAFLKKEDLEKPETAYPLDVFFCRNCRLVQLGYMVDPNALFRDYAYNTGTNNSLKVNFKNLVDKIVAHWRLSPADLAVDIGSNDGTLLENYLPYQIRILGIDPSSAAKLALQKNIPTIIDFFNEETAVKVRKEYGPAKIITATNVFAHVDKLYSFLRGVFHLLADDGVFISESHYLADLIFQRQYDSIYHEHLRYYSLKPLTYLFKQLGMEIIDAERISTHGGSIRVSTAKTGKYPVAEAVAKLTAAEAESGLDDEKTFVKFAEQVESNKFELLKTISDLKKEGKSIAGIGAPAKGNTLLNYCNLDSSLIDYLAEKSEIKIGLFAPGTHIPVVAEERLFREQPDYGLLLSWNIADELVPKLRAAGYKGKFIIPNPTVRII